MMHLLPLLLACAQPADSDTDTGTDSTTSTDSGDPGTSTAPPRELVPVAAPRELRGVWIATVWNINFPSSQSLSVSAQQAELQALVDTAADAHLNALFFQVRPEGDALYASSLEPWSNVLTGTQGQDPGYDPLQTLIEKAHARNIEVHAWLNPYRAKAASSQQVAPHLAAIHPEWVYSYGSSKWMDPGIVGVRQRLVDVCSDLVSRYELDGVHFDDYFYPYPETGVPFPDSATYDAYTAGGGTLALADWRRQNVTSAIADVSAAVASIDDSVRFGVAPFGIPAPDKPTGISGFDQYAQLYADTQGWMDAGLVDYLAPQLYWPSTQSAQAYEPLMAWWTGHVLPGHYIFGGNYLSELGSATKWPLSEFLTEAEITRSYADQGAGGNIWYQIAPLLENRLGVKSAFATLYATPALTPPLANSSARTVAPPNVVVSGDALQLSYVDAAPARAFTLYAPHGEGWALERVLPADTTSWTPGPGRWAVAAVSRHGVESQAVVVQVP